MSSSSIPPDLLPYLTGQKTDFSTLQTSITTVNIVILSFSCLTTLLRFYVRFGVLRSPGLDDLFLAIALTFSILLSASCLVGVHFGLGKHLWNLSPNLLLLPVLTGRITKSLYGAYLAYSTAITFTKLSIISLYLRVFTRNQSRSNANTKLLRRILYGTTFIVVAFWIASIFVIIFTCRPVQAAWDYSITNAKCISIVKFFYVSAAFNIATDLLLCFMPLPTLWALKMPKVQRVVLCVLFSMGTFACTASILRLSQIHNIGNSDVTYGTVTTLNWSVIEVGVAIMCTSLSALRPLATRYLPTLFSHFAGGSSATLPTYTAYPRRAKNDVAMSQALSQTMSRTCQSQIERSRCEGEEVEMKQGMIMVDRTFDVWETGMDEREVGDVEVQKPGAVGMGVRRNGSGSGPRPGFRGLWEGSSEEDLVLDKTERER